MDCNRKNELFHLDFAAPLTFTFIFPFLFPSPPAHQCSPLHSTSSAAFLSHNVDAACIAEHQVSQARGCSLHGFGSSWLTPPFTSLFPFLTSPFWGSGNHRAARAPAPQGQQFTQGMLRLARQDNTVRMSIHILTGHAAVGRVTPRKIFGISKGPRDPGELGSKHRPLISSAG